MSVEIGYQAEVRGIDQAIATIAHADLFSTPIDSMRVTRYIYRLYQRASISGDLAALRTTEQATERALPLLVHKGDLYLLKGKIAFSLHRLADAEAALAAGPA